MKNRLLYLALFFGVILSQMPKQAQSQELLTIEDLLREQTFTNYDDAFANPWNVYILDMASSDLTFLSDRISKLVNLQILVLADNPKLDYSQAFTEKFFGALPLLQIIDLQENYLRDLPEGLTLLRNVKNLYLGSNQLSNLPAEIANFHALEVLSLHHNRLKSLPDTLYTLSNLKELDLSYNPTLPINQFLPMFSILPNFQVIYLAGCNLKSVPPALLDCHRLNYINLSDNGLTQLPDQLFTLAELAELAVTKNKLKSLPSEIQSASKLEVLVASQNELLEVPAALNTLPSLVYLDLSKNKLRRLPDDFFNSKSIKEINLLGNEINTLPPSIGDATALEVLNLEFNKLRDIPLEIARLTQLKELRLTGNVLSKEVKSNLKQWLPETKIVY